MFSYRISHEKQVIIDYLYWMKNIHMVHSPVFTVGGLYSLVPLLKNYGPVSASQQHPQH